MEFAILSRKCPLHAVWEGGWLEGCSSFYGRRVFTYRFPPPISHLPLTTTRFFCCAELRARVGASFVPRPCYSKSWAGLRARRAWHFVVA